MNQYSDESLESRWYREHSIRIHKKRLQDIKDRSVALSKEAKRFSSVKRRKVSKDHPKLNEVYRENMILYDKLTMISERKHSPNTFKGPRSLNITIRKKEAERIIHDNLEFVKRLTEKESFVSARKLKDEYLLMEKYKKTISKANLHERLKKITLNDLRLPPINHEITMNTDRSRKPKEMKSESGNDSAVVLVSKLKPKFHLEKSATLGEKHSKMEEIKPEIHIKSDFYLPVSVKNELKSSEEEVKSIKDSGAEEYSFDESSHSDKHNAEVLEDSKNAESSNIDLPVLGKSDSNLSKSSINPIKSPSPPPEPSHIPPESLPKSASHSSLPP